MDNIERIKKLLQMRAELQARLEVLPYQGTPEIKTLSGERYLYVRQKTLDKVTSTYVGKYEDELYNLLLRNQAEAKSLRRQIKAINRELLSLGFVEGEVSQNVLLNIEFAKANMKQIIYDQAILEGVGTTFPDTEAILENGIVNNMTVDDVQKVLNLKHAWQFILDPDVGGSKTDYPICCYIARLVNEGFYQNGGSIRSLPVTIGGSSYIPPIPYEHDVKDRFKSLLEETPSIEIAIELCLYVMKTQVYLDGNKRTAVILANHYLISNGLGLLIIGFERVEEFKKYLVLYYEDKDLVSVKEFLKTCIVPLRS